ncbi:response regulator [Paenibacillus sp. GCM10027628]|uniref:response regulator transcription factor n=1 Tax=Paenibacillus sp. GCM10027628 TaxID=3273413 RepID=UPI00362FCB5C
MFSLLIVDDEPLAIRGIQSAIDWKRLGIDPIHTANNAAQAKEVYGNHRIDMMLCDIEMPQDSGLDLLGWVKVHSPDTETVFLTCHADFAFAKQAIQLGSFDYLLKPIPPEELATVIRRVIEKIRKVKEMAQINRSWVQHHPLFIEQFWLDIVNQVIPANPEAIRKAMEERKIAHPGGLRMLPVLIDVQRWHKPLTLRDEKILEYGLKNAALETIQELQLSAQLMTLDRNVLLAVITLPLGDRADLQSLRSQLNAFISTCYRYFYCDLSCYVGEPADYHKLPEMVNRLITLKKNNVAYSKQVFLGSVRPERLISAEIPDMKIWSVLLTQGAKDQIITEVSAYLEKLVNNSRIDVPFLHQFHHDFIQIVYSVLKEKGIQAHELFKDSRSIELSTQANRSVTDMLEWISHMLNRAVAHTHDMEESHSVVEKVKLFIAKHFDQDLSREQIASPFFLHPDYLDRMLKKEIGMSMKEFLLHERMRVAQDLLSKTEMPVTSVATHVGFNNLSHFTKMFRKQTELSPSDFRQHARK